MHGSLVFYAGSVALAAALTTSLVACSPDRSEPRSDVAKVTEPAKAAISDSAITAKVKSKLLADPEVKGLNISVETKNGVVALTGKVGGANERAKAVTLARNVEGVKDVTDGLN